MRYLQSQPFSGATSNGRMTDLQYDVAVGNLVLCPICGDYVKPAEIDLCPMRKIAEIDGDLA